MIKRVETSQLNLRLVNRKLLIKVLNLRLENQLNGAQLYFT